MYTCVSSVNKFATCEQFRCAVLRATMEAWFWSCTTDDECKTREPSANDRLIIFKNENGLEEYRGPRAPLVCCDALVRKKPCDVSCDLGCCAQYQARGSLYSHQRRLRQLHVYVLSAFVHQVACVSWCVVVEDLQFIACAHVLQRASVGRQGNAMKVICDVDKLKRADLVLQAQQIGDCIVDDRNIPQRLQAL